MSVIGEIALFLWRTSKLFFSRSFQMIQVAYGVFQHEFKSARQNLLFKENSWSYDIWIWYDMRDRTRFVANALLESAQ